MTLLLESGPGKRCIKRHTRQALGEPKNVTGVAAKR